jgi:hypothetical protein
MKQFYAYLYIDPTTDGVFYVGKGSNRRYKRHLVRKDKHPLTQKLSKMGRDGITPTIEVIHATNELAAFWLERCLIAAFGRKDQGLGTLLNLTEGGEGNSGYVASNELREKRSQNAKRLGLIPPKNFGEDNPMKNPETVAKVVAYNTGKPKSIEARKKMSDAKRGRKLSESHKAAIALSVKKAKSHG